MSSFRFPRFLSLRHLILCGRAGAVISTIDKFLHEQNVIETILTQYREFCHSDDAQRLRISEGPITNETLLRLRFECLSFSTFLASLQSAGFFTEKRWFKTRPNQELIKMFDRALGSTLTRFCNANGVDTLREIAIVAVTPKPTFGFGEKVDPVNRLEEYQRAFERARGSEVECFGKWVGKTLDPPNYPLLELIGVSFGSLLLQLSHVAMVHVFMAGEDELRRDD